MKKFWIGGLAVFLSVMAATPAFAGTWVQDTNRPENQQGISNWWYRNDDGNYPANGWYWLDGNNDGYAESYRFDANGWMYISAKVDGYDVDGSGAWTIGGEVQRKYVGTSETSTQANGSGNSTGTDAGTTVKNQWVNDGIGKRYYNSKGEPTIGWKKISSKRYYFDDSGYALTGYQEVEGQYYYFYEDGELATKTVYSKEYGVYYVIDKEEYYIVDEVDAADWNEYKREADREAVEVSKVTDESKNNYQSPSVSTSSSDLYDGINEEWAMACFDLINEEREKRGIAPLEYNPVLQEACNVRAQEIVDKYSHTRPDGTSCFSILGEFDLSYRTCGENIYSSPRSPEAAVEGWMNSTGHRNNILNEKFTESAVGFYYDSSSTWKYHWVQLFYTPY